MTTEQMDWLDDERAGRHKIPPVSYPKSDFRVTDLAALESPTVSDLLRRVQKDLMDEDARMRSEVLPDPPEGWEWRCELQSSTEYDFGAHARGEVTYRLTYRLEAV